jgi:hypothetical protein
MHRIFANLFAVAVFAGASVAAFAANPSLEIQSPPQNATVRGTAVEIQFRLHDFKVVSLKNLAVGGARSARPQAAPASDEDSGMPGMSASSAGTGMGPNREASVQPSAGPGASPEQVGTGSGMSQSGGGGPAPVKPNEGFIVVSVDNAPFYFIHSTADPILLAGLQPGQHKVTLRLVTDDSKPTGTEQTLNFTVAGMAPAGAAPTTPPQQH